MTDYLVTPTADAYGGKSIARLPDGRALFVPFTLPGETVRVRLTSEHSGYTEGEVSQLIEPSPARVQPRCRHFGQCGGCHYQHMEYPAQLAAKRAILRDQFVRLGGLVDPPVAPTVPSPQIWRYRNQMQFHRAADGRLGLQAARSHTVIPLTECHLPEPALDQAWRQQSTEGAQTRTRRGQRQKGRQRVVLRVGDEQVVQLEDGAPIHLPVLGRRFQVSAGAFFQVNLAGAELMVQHVLGHWPGRSVAHALDLYCGVGLFSAFLAPHVPKLTAVESSTPACTDFVVNLHGFDHVALVSGRVEEMLATLDQPVDYVLADPPRAGLGEAVIRQLLRLAPAHLVYVSCDPATLARDARQLVAGGYRLEQATPFDLFPQTYHIESINRFIKVIDKVIDA